MTPSPLPVAKDETVNKLIAEFARVYSPHEARETLLAKYAARAEFGYKKYGKTTDERTDIDQIGWLTHFQEEVMDATVYAVRILRDVPESDLGHAELYAHLRSLMEMALFATASITALSRK